MNSQLFLIVSLHLSLSLVSCSIYHDHEKNNFLRTASRLTLPNIFSFLGSNKPLPHLALGKFSVRKQSANELDSSDDPEEVDINSKIRINERAFEEKSEEWMIKNRDMVRDAMRWVLLGLVILVVATGFFLFSEIRHAIIVRQLDQSRLALPIAADIVEKKNSSDAQRPYLSLGAVAFMVIGAFIGLATLCGIVSSLLEATAGYRYRGCLYVAALAALLTSAVWSLLLLAASWLCVRPHAAVACLVAGALGAAALSTMDGPTVVLWTLLAGAAAFALIRYGGPQWVLDAPLEQDKGEKARLLDRSS